MAAEQHPEQLYLGAEPLSDEQLNEVKRLAHGVAVLDYFQKEVDLQNRRDDFLFRSRPGSDSRAEILAGPAYNGDEEKLRRAIAKTRSKTVFAEILASNNRKAQLELAGHLGIAAHIEKNCVVTETPEDSEEFFNTYAKWRMQFARHSSKKARDQYRAYLQEKTLAITGKPIDAPEIASPAPAVNIEERAILLVRAINAMAHRSRLSGLIVAIPDKQYNEPIYGRYGVETTDVDDNSQNRTERLFAAARRDAVRASGYTELRVSGLMSEELFERRTNKMWHEFAGQFEHSPQQKLRVKVRKQLRKYIPPERMHETSIDDI